MKEAEITCLCLSIRLADLGEVMFKGQTIYVEAERARSSKDLETARKSSGVSVRYVERCKERREGKQEGAKTPDPPSRTMITPSRESPPGFDVDNLVTQLKDRLPQIDSSQIQQMIRKELSSALAPVIEGLAQRVVSPANSNKQESEGKINKKERDTVFVPRRIMGDRIQADISVDEDESEGGGVDAASEALKRARKHGKKD